MINHYKGTYRLKVPYDINTNQFLRKLDGTLEDIDVYIDCVNGKIFSYGHSVLQAYIPSLQTGRNIIKQIYAEYINPQNVNIMTTTSDRKDGKSITRTSYSIIDNGLFGNELNNNNIIFNIEETDSELLFRFKAKDDEKVIPLMKPKTSGASISPFSSRNLPKNNDYKIPYDKIVEYKTIIAKIPPERLLSLGHIQKNFLESISTKKFTYDDIKADMTKKGLKGKEYIHSINRFDDYLKYLEKNL